MINNITDGISIKLNQVFGESYGIYSEGVTQGLQEPCFFIAALNTTQTPMVGNRSFRQQQFDIHYFPSIKDNNAEMQNIASDLYQAMTWITLINGDKLHGTKMNHQVIDGVLHFFVQYNMFITVVEDPEEAMGDVKVISNVKE